MTNKQGKIFSQILDENWKMKQAFRAGNIKKTIKYSVELSRLKEKLKKDMGEAKYNEFMEAGKKMFAPKNEAA